MAREEEAEGGLVGLDEEEGGEETWEVLGEDDAGRAAEDALGRTFGTAAYSPGRSIEGSATAVSGSHLPCPYSSPK